MIELFVMCYTVMSYPSLKFLFYESKCFKCVTGGVSQGEKQIIIAKSFTKQKYLNTRLLCQFTKVDI